MSIREAATNLGLICGLLIAILAVGVLNLIATGVQTGLLIRVRSPLAMVAADTSQSLPKQYTDAVLAGIAKRVTVPYNEGNVEALYNTFDDVVLAPIQERPLASTPADDADSLGITLADRVLLHPIRSDRDRLRAASIETLREILRIHGSKKGERHD